MTDLAEAIQPAAADGYEDALRGGAWIPHRGIRVWQPTRRAPLPPCPKCGVGEGARCRTERGFYAGNEHAARRARRAAA